ncbi:MAG: flavoprotein, partial [Rhizobiaceae bacterium]
MASITIRNLDPDIKEALRRRAAANGRSMEEEARHFLAELAVAANAPRSSGLAATPAGLALPIAGATPSGSPLDGKAILLVIGGGIAAYKSLDLIRRLRERGAKVRVVMTAAAQEFVTDLAAGAL